MSASQDTLEAQLAALEAEAAAFKTSQPFYDGTLKLLYLATAAAYDFRYQTTKSFTEFDVYQTLQSVVQDYPLIVPFVFIMDDSGVPYGPGQAQYLRHPLTLDPGDYPGLSIFELNLSTFNIPVGTWVRVKIRYVTTSPITTVSSTGDIRP